MLHRWKWISALIFAALLGLGFWLRQPATSRLSAPTAVEPAPQPLTPPWPASSASAAAEAANKVVQPDEIEVCGVGKAKIDRDDSAATGKYLDALTRNARIRWLASLRNSADYHARAAGLYLEGIFDRDSPRGDVDAAREELVQLALATREPAAFALAYAKCNKGVESLASQGACPELILDDWSHADPDNAVPWLQQAAKARRDGDASAEAAAMLRAAQAHRYESYNWSLFSFAQATLPNDAGVRWMLTTQLIGVEAAMRAPDQSLFQYCSRDALNDTAVRQECGALAELMVSKGATLLELNVGKALGARVGWSAERLDELTQESKASMQIANEMTGTDPKQQWNCDSAARGNAYMSRLDELGERGLARQAIAGSGETVAELSRKFDEWLVTAGTETRPAQP
jgi:hypothetical protein